jgi:hypothetical protein
MQCFGTRPFATQAVGHLSDFEVSMDAVMWRSTDGRSWGQAEVIAGGPGNQIAYSVTARDDEIIVGGLDGQSPAIWQVPNEPGRG